MSARGSIDTLSPRALSPSRANGFAPVDSLQEPLLPQQEAAAPGDGKRGRLVAELRKLLKLAGPLIIQNLFGYLLSVVSAAFIGHLNDPVALSSAVLAGSFYNITGYSLVIGLSAGMETLCGQAYGAKNYPMLGLILQRALLICWAACIPIALFWSQADRLLMLLHQQPEIVAGACRYLHIATPALFLSAISSCVFRYLVTQQEVRPSTVCTIITAALCPLYNWFFVYHLNWRLDGAAVAFLLSTGTYSALLTAYTAVRDWRRRHKPSHTWPGFTWRALEGWGPYLRMAAPAAAMICMEWWIFEFVIFMAGSLGDFADVAVAVMGLSFHITSWTYMIPMSIGTAANTRVSNELGAGCAVGARRAARVAIACGLCVQLCVSVFLYTGRHTVVKMFTTQPDIVYHVGRIMPVLAVSCIGDGLIAVMAGVLRGSGRQSLGAALNLVGYWCVGCPVALLLGFHFRLDVMGFWMGLASATSLRRSSWAVCCRGSAGPARWLAPPAWWRSRRRRSRRRMSTGRRRRRRGGRGSGRATPRATPRSSTCTSRSRRRRRPRPRRRRRWWWRPLKPRRRRMAFWVLAREEWVAPAAVTRTKPCRGRTRWM